MNLIPSKFYLDDMFDDLLMTTKNNAMKCDIYEQEGKYYIKIDIPGFDKDDINIEENNGYLTVSANKDIEEDIDNKNYIRRERKYGKYERSFYLGDLATDEIKAEFKDGTLNIVIPKKEVEVTKKTIQID